MNAMAGKPFGAMGTGNHDVDIGIVPTNMDRQRGPRVSIWPCNQCQRRIKFASKLFYGHHWHPKTKKYADHRHPANGSQSRIAGILHS